MHRAESVVERTNRHVMQVLMRAAKRDTVKENGGGLGDEEATKYDSVSHVP